MVDPNQKLPVKKVVPVHNLRSFRPNSPFTVISTERSEWRNLNFQNRLPVPDLSIPLRSTRDDHEQLCNPIGRSLPIPLILMTLIGFLMFTTNASHSLAAQQDSAPTAENHSTNNDKSKFTPPTPEQEKNRREFNAMLWASMIILAGMFLLVFILFIFRMARSVRRLHNLGKERTHTECIDAWSQHRLPDDSPLDSWDLN